MADIHPFPAVARPRVVDLTAPVITDQEDAFWSALGSLEACLLCIRVRGDTALSPTTNRLAADISGERVLDAITKARAQLGVIEGLLTNGDAA